MAARWLSEVMLKEALGAIDAQALLESLGGLEFYVPVTPRETNILGRDLSKILSRAGLLTLVALTGGQLVKLPNYRRTSSAGEVRRLLKEGLPNRKIADALCLSQRYVERLAAEERNKPQQLSLFDML